MEQRVQKLLILVGEEGVDVEARDYQKLRDVITTYLNDKNQSFNEFFVKISQTVIAEISLKHHIYALLTAEISDKYPQISTNIIESSLHRLQQSLSQAKLYQAVNIISYLSQLINLSLLNSSILISIIEDMLKILQTENHHNSHRKLLMHVLSKTIPFCGRSLQQKMPQEFKKLIDKMKKILNKNQALIRILNQYGKNNYGDSSQIGRLTDVSKLPISQYHSNFKLQFNNPKVVVSHIPEFTNYFDNHDESYQQFINGSEAYIHLNNIDNLLCTFEDNSQLLTLKMVNYMKHYSGRNHIYRLAIETLFNRALSGKMSIVQCTILVNLSRQETIGKEWQHVVNEALLRLFRTSESLNLDALMELTKVISFVYNSGVLKDIWEWCNYLEMDEKALQAEIILKISMERIQLLNEKVEINQMKKYTPQKRKNQEEYTLVEDMERFEEFTNQLSAKAESSIILPSINTQHHYEIFLEALFRRTSLSQTHLQILLSRYQQVFEQFKQDYDWALINKIRNYWSLSFFNRLLYLNQMISRDYLTYESYVKYIGQFQCHGVQQAELKLELNELNKIYGKMLGKP